MTEIMYQATKYLPTNEDAADTHAQWLESGWGGEKERGREAWRRELNNEWLQIRQRIWLNDFSVSRKDKP